MAERMRGSGLPGIGYVTKPCSRYVAACVGRVGVWAALVVEESAFSF